MDSFFKTSFIDPKQAAAKRSAKASSDLASPSELLTIAIAISGSEKSKNVLNWALKKFGSEKNVVFKLIHIHPKVITVPTPSGNTVPISEAPEDVAATHRQKVMQDTKETLLKPFRKMCERKKVAVELVVLESNNVAVAINREVNEHLIIHLVIGRSSNGALSSNDLSATISAYVSKFCTVYIVSKGAYMLSKESVEIEKSESVRDSGNERTDTSSWSSGSGHTSDVMSNSLKSNPHSLSNKRLQQLLIENNSAESDETRGVSTDVPEEGSKKGSPETSRSTVSWNTRIRDFDERKDALSFTSSNRESGSHSDNYFIDNEDTLNEITKLRAELRHAVAQVETLDASRKLNELSFREHETKILLAGNETQITEAEMKGTSEAKEESSVMAPKVQYQEFTWEEITAATSSFSEDLKIGMGAYGDVYKCNLHHTIAAVKVLHSADLNLSKQFDQELEILSKIRHPHLVLLLGACPERGALVYEYMENGSLDDRLFQVNNSEPIPWFVRFRIAWEVASALVFLHKSKPTPIIHRDLKPGNILLDKNFVSKVGDVGLSTMIQVDQLSSNFTMYKQTSPVGTLCYIDPEYQRTGMLSPKSDVYAFGMILLQLLTGQQAMALTYTVEIAMENNDDEELIQILDKKAGSWPIEETKKLAALALSCTEIRAKDRPNLKEQILPALESLKKVADEAKNSLSDAPSQPPSHFICPLLKDVMKEPCVAADGYTYDRSAIEEWMENNRTSPVTNSPLENVNLLPNHTLGAAIFKWRDDRKTVRQYHEAKNSAPF